MPETLTENRMQALRTVLVELDRLCELAEERGHENDAYHIKQAMGYTGAEQARVRDAQKEDK